MKKISTHYNVVLIAFAAAISGLLFGYDAGIVSGAMLFVRKTFVLTEAEVGWIVSAVPLGALITSMLIGWLSDQFGRKKVLLMTALFFMLGSLCCAMATDPQWLLMGRVLMGFAVGMSSSLSPVYIAEISEKERRGRLVTLFLISVNFGIFVSYLTGFAFAASGSWRWMLGLGVLPALVLALFILLLPESPRWLVLKNRIEEARAILLKTLGAIRGPLELQEIQYTLSKEQSVRSPFGRGSFLFNPSFLKVVILGALIGIFTQAVGINAIIYYAPTIFQKTGFNATTVSILASLGIGFTVTISAVLAAVFIDRIGRRTLLLVGLLGIILSLCLIIFAFEFVHNQMTLAWLALIGCVLFVACQGLSVGPACFLLPSEIFPARIRGIGMGVSITFNWLTNFLVALLFPMMLSRYGMVSTFKVFLFLSLVGWVVFFLYVPETRKISLEQIELNILSNRSLRCLGE